MGYLKMIIYDVNVTIQCIIMTESIFVLLGFPGGRGHINLTCVYLILKPFCLPDFVFMLVYPPLTFMFGGEGGGLRITDSIVNATDYQVAAVSNNMGAVHWKLSKVFFLGWDRTMV